MSSCRGSDEISEHCPRDAGALRHAPAALCHLEHEVAGRGEVSPSCLHPALWSMEEGVGGRGGAPVCTRCVLTVAGGAAAIVPLTCRAVFVPG